MAVKHRWLNHLRPLKNNHTHSPLTLWTTAILLIIILIAVMDSWESSSPPLKMEQSFIIKPGSLGTVFCSRGSKMNLQLENSRFLGEWARLGSGWSLDTSAGNECKSISFYADEEITQKPPGASAPHQNADYYNSRQQITFMDYT